MMSTLRVLRSFRARGNPLAFRAVALAQRRMISTMELPLPALSPTMEVGAINSWKKKVGDFVEPGEVIADIQTDKAVVDFEVQDEGYLAAIFVGEGEELPVGTLVALLVEDEADLEEAKSMAASMASQGGEAPAAAAEAPAESSAPVAASTGSSDTFEVKSLLPATEILLHRHNIDPASIKPSGPKGHILKGDVLEAIESGSYRTLSAEQQQAAVAANAAAAAATATAPETKAVPEAKAGGVTTPPPPCGWEGVH